MSKILTLYKRVCGDDPRANQLFDFLKKNGYRKLEGVKIEQVMRLEKPAIGVADLLNFQKIFEYPGAEVVTLSSALDSSDGPIVEISYQRAWTDPELDSILHAAEGLSITGLEWARLTTRYQFIGLTERAVNQIAKFYLFNPTSQVIIKPGEIWLTLKPQGEHEIIPDIDIANMSLKMLKELGEKQKMALIDNQLLAMANIFKQQGRPAHNGELCMIPGYWGDHCKHSSWKSLGLFQDIEQAIEQANDPLIYEALIDNAGAMNFYGNWVITIKGESHIWPFNVEPYGGILTLHGGVQRDVIKKGQGAQPWGGSIIIGICDPRIPRNQHPKGALHPQVLLRESIRATKDYTNPMGITMMHSQYLIHPRNVKALAWGHCVGVMPKKRAKKGVPHVGDYAIVIGGGTGRDGVNASVLASDVNTSKSVVEDKAGVQIGMAIVQRKVMEAIPILRDKNCTRAITDCGALGLASACGEMGEKVLWVNVDKTLNLAGDSPAKNILSSPIIPSIETKNTETEKLTSGIWINLAWVHLKCAGMSSGEIWISESQERGVICVPPEKLDEALEILSDYGVPASVIGIFTDTEHCQVIYDKNIDKDKWIKNPHWRISGEESVNLPYSVLEDCPLPDIKISKPKEKPKPFVPPVPKNKKEWIKLVQKHLGHFNISNQSAAAHEYDQTVQGNTAMPYMVGDNENVHNEIFAATPVPNKPWTAGTANAVNQFYSEINAAEAGKLILAQSFTKLIAAGFSTDALTCNANVYTPRIVGYPENAWRLVQLVRHGYIPASKKMMRVLSGKDSSSGTFVILATGEIIHVSLTLDIMALGRMPHYNRLIPKAFSHPGDIIVLYTPGITKLALGGSTFLDLYGERGDELCQVDLDELGKGLRKYHTMLNKSNWSKNIHSRSVIEDGGLIRRLFEMSIGHNLGCQVELGSKNILNLLFAEMNTGIVFATDPKNMNLTADCLKNCVVLGEVSDKPQIEVLADGQRLFKSTTNELSKEWSKTFEEVAS